MPVRAAVAAVWLVLAAVGPAFGQTGRGPAFEAGGGYAFLGGAGTAEGYGAGWFVDGGWRAASWLTVAGEFGRHRRRQDLGFVGMDTTVDSLMAGVRIVQRRARLAPYGQVMVGAVRLRRSVRLTFPVAAAAGGASAYGALQLGGGVELPLATRLALRVGADYRRVPGAARLDHHRFFTAAVYAFGGG